MNAIGIKILGILSCCILACAVFRLAGCKSRSADRSHPEDERFILKNGLRVVLRPVIDCNELAAVLLYDIGSDHDPEGRSGLGHLIEHLYVTAAAGTTGARDIQTYMLNYPAGWNAQTGSAFTVVAAVFQCDRMNQELADSAARMENLNLTQADIDREKPRLVDELTNMFERMPQLAAANRAREKVRPSPNDGRKGGIAEQVNSITIEQLRERLSRFYKPTNAILVLAGGFKTAEAKQMVEQHFSQIPSGEKCPTVSPARIAGVKGGFERVNVRPLQPGMPGFAAVSVRAPLPDDPNYPAFLVVARRLSASSNNLPATEGFFPVNYAILDDPEVLTVSLPLKSGETPEKTVEHLNAFIDETLGRQFQHTEIQTTVMTYGFFVGMAEGSPQNLYGLAFSIARRLQLGVDGERLSRIMYKLTAKDIDKVTNTYFNTDSRAAVAVIPE
jgi:zinc protease